MDGNIASSSPSSSLSAAAAVSESDGSPKRDSSLPPNPEEDKAEDLWWVTHRTHKISCRILTIITKNNNDGSDLSHSP